MHFSIKNAKGVSIDPASGFQGLEVKIDGVKAEDLLAHIDIVTAIHYYGITELLDTIGEEQLKSYLECL